MCMFGAQCTCAFTNRIYVYIDVTCVFKLQHFSIYYSDPYVRISLYRGDRDHGLLDTTTTSTIKKVDMIHFIIQVPSVSPTLCHLHSCYNLLPPLCHHHHHHHHHYSQPHHHYHHQFINYYWYNNFISTLFFFSIVQHTVN